MSGSFANHEYTEKLSDVAVSELSNWEPTDDNAMWRTMCYTHAMGTRQHVDLELCVATIRYILDIQLSSILTLLVCSILVVIVYKALAVLLT